MNHLDELLSRHLDKDCMSVVNDFIGCVRFYHDKELNKEIYYSINNNYVHSSIYYSINNNYVHSYSNRPFNLNVSTKLLNYKYYIIGKFNVGKFNHQTRCYGDLSWYQLVKYVPEDIHMVANNYFCIPTVKLPTDILMKILSYDYCSPYVCLSHYMLKIRYVMNHHATDPDICHKVLSVLSVKSLVECFTTEVKMSELTGLKYNQYKFIFDYLKKNGIKKCPRGLSEYADYF